MEKDVMIGIFILVISIILLGFVLYVNINDTFAFLSDPMIGEGFGLLCSTPEECKAFCHTNRGRCNKYCNEYPENALCKDLFYLGIEDLDN